MRRLPVVNPRRGRATTLLVALIVVIGAAACTSGNAASPGGAGRLNVVTSTTVFADMVAQIGGDLVNVQSLVPPNQDVHTFSPKPSDILHLADAKLVVMNGLGLDDWLGKTVDAVATGAPVIRLAVDLPGVDYLTGDDPGGPANRISGWMSRTGSCTSTGSRPG